jgi:integrase/recombinase XerD
MVGIRKRTHALQEDTMNAIMNRTTDLQTQTQERQEITSTMLADYIKWIDRSENTQRAYIIDLRQFMAWLRYTQNTHPLRENIIEYRDWLVSEHEAIQLDGSAGWSYRTDGAGNPIKVTCRPATVAQYLRALCQFFKWTSAEGLYPDISQNVHAPKVSHDTHRKEALTAEAVLAIEDSIASKAQERHQAAAEAVKDKTGKLQRTTEQGLRERAMYLLAVNAGLRTIEISRACVKDLEVMNGTAFLYIWGKGHSEADQKKPLAPEVYEAIKAYLSSRADHPTGSSPLFASTGNRSGGQRIAPTTISTMLKRSMQAAGYDSPRLTAHSLRHTAGTNVMRISGGNLYATQKYMRHSNPATTEIYLHTDTERQEATIAQELYDSYHGRPVSSEQGKLQQTLARLTPAQLLQLADLAAEMAH